jgi:hypothetical protein
MLLRIQHLNRFLAAQWSFSLRQKMMVGMTSPATKYSGCGMGRSESSGMTAMLLLEHV